MLIIGLMSGTSADGIDAALVEIEGEGRTTQVKLREFLYTPYSKEMHHAILNAANPAHSSSQNICALNVALGELFAKAAHDVCRAAGIDVSSVKAIASHGQTVWHEPKAFEIGGMSVTGTLQIGEPTVIAARTGRQVVSNFRSADMAVGGQGAPLVPYFDWAVLGSDSESRAVLNIGGIANITYLPKGAGLDKVIAFDTGPGNMLIDDLVRRFTNGQQRFDKDGEWAAKEQYGGMLAEWLLSDPYFDQPPPKSTGRELFSTAFVDKFVNFCFQFAEKRNIPRETMKSTMLATATVATAGGVWTAHEKWLKPLGGADVVIVGGGGVHNKTLMTMLAEQLAPIRVTTHEEFGIQNDAKEAMAFALLSYETLHGRPGNVPSATGASRPVVLGSITPAP